ncbi:MAG: hypothetical protein ACI93R_000841 [Flavobacteriales bacterium]|jgi:hypothetical protein
MNHWPSFDRLSELAQRDPKQLERMRLQEVEQLIQSAPESYQRRLRGLQFQIDCKRELHKNSVGACVELSKMMLDSVQRLNTVLNGGFDNTDADTQEPSKVVSFPA